MVLENSLRAFFLTFLRTIPFSRQVTAKIQIKILSARGGRHRASITLRAYLISTYVV